MYVIVFGFELHLTRQMAASYNAVFFLLYYCSLQNKKKGIKNVHVHGAETGIALSKKKKKKMEVCTLQLPREKIFDLKIPQWQVSSMLISKLKAIQRNHHKNMQAQVT